MSHNLYSWVIVQICFVIDSSAITNTTSWLVMEHWHVKSENVIKIAILGQVVLQGLQVILQSARNFSSLCLQPWYISVFLFRLAVSGWNNIKLYYLKNHFYSQRFIFGSQTKCFIVHGLSNPQWLLLLWLLIFNYYFIFI